MEVKQNLFPKDTLISPEPTKSNRKVKNTAKKVDKVVKEDLPKLDDKDTLIIRAPCGDLPGLGIDPTQKKHQTSWPISTSYQGKRGTPFPEGFTNDDVIELVSLIGKNPPFSTAPSSDKDKVPLKITCYLNEFDKKNDLITKLKKFNTIGVQSAFNTSKNQWEVHIFPEK